MRRLLLQTTIAGEQDDWNVGRFGRLRRFLSELEDDSGQLVFEVTARDRVRRGEPDPVMSALHRLDVDQLWLMATDSGDGLTPEDCAAIGEFRRRGGGLLVARDHMDLGSSICGLAGVGAAHHFHSINQEPDTLRHCADDPFTPGISWPNYHSGPNGDFQRVWTVGNIHAVMRDRHSATGVIQYLPSHPHEGAVGAPPGDKSCRVIMEGRSAATGRRFSIAVAFERYGKRGRAIAQSTFHHFTDYNWHPADGCPSFVTEPPGNGMDGFPEALRSTKQYVRNVALWLRR